MTEKDTATRGQRITARVSIASFVIVALVVMMFPNTSFGSIFQLQQTNSPTPSESGSPSGSPSEGSPSPSPTGIQPIQWLNPSSHSDVISTKDDGTNQSYHLVAVVKDVPANPVVEFKYQIGTGNEVSIGVATRVGETDTWHLQWSLGDLADGSIVLKAILYNGTIEVGRDEQDATINNSDDLDDPQAETVEIVSPGNGAPAGFFHPVGADVAHTVITVTSSDDSGFPSGSTGTDTVVGFYTKTPPGQEPEWIECGDAGGEDPGETTRFRCSLEEGDNHTQVTGLAAVANPVLPLIGGSGDAHRVFAYEQIPTSVALNPETQPSQGAGSCAEVVTATILDQNNTPIAGVNTDVHAKGPTDDLRFDDSGNNSSAHAPPDKAHTEPEQGRDCESTSGANGGTQGQHELAPGNPDIKHVESTAATGTALDGTFRFQVWSPHVGTTAIGVWADEDDDDQWCTEEASNEGSISWILTASASPTPSASGSPSQSPSESPSGSPSGSPTGGGGGGATPTPEPTELGPELQSCPRATGSPSPTDTGPTANRTISLESSKGKVLQRRPVRLQGRIEAQNQSCTDDEIVEIRRRIHGSNRFKDFRTTATDNDGTYEARIKPARGADYQAVTPAAGACDEASSGVATVRVRPKVGIAASNYKGVSRGDRVRIVGRVVPGHPRTKVVLQRKKGGKWVKVKAQRLNRNSRYRFTVRANWDQRKFRTIWRKQHVDHIKGKSRVITIRTI